jgi:hypothetical protein
MQNTTIQYYHHGRFKVAGGVLPEHTVIQTMRKLLFSLHVTGQNSRLEVSFIDSDHEASCSSVSHAGQDYLVGEGKVCRHRGIVECAVYIMTTGP